jgi:flagellar biosynthesis GTPase FlhF
MAQFAIKDIQANPFRHIDRYPIHREKVAKLRESLRQTGFWENVVARSRDGKAEIAYGHHRLVALKEEYGPSHKVDLIIKKLDDQTMIQIMAQENMQEWESDAAVIHETIRAVVEAYGKGLIELRAVNPNTEKGHIRYAPSFIAGGPARADGRFAYTGQTVAEFLGWLTGSRGLADDKVNESLAALQFIEEGLLKDADFDGLTIAQAEAVITEARRARTRRDAAARVHKMQAEQAAREAEAAVRRREEAERERKRQEAEASIARAARDAEARRRAEAEAKRHEQQRREAEEQRKTAVKRQQVETQKAQKFVDEGRRQATVVGRAVSKSLKAGETTTRGASEVAARVDTKRDQPPPQIDIFAKRLATDLNSILDPDRDPRVRKLKELVQYQEYLGDYERANLARTLQTVSDRALDYAKQLSGSSVPARLSLPAKRS